MSKLGLTFEVIYTHFKNEETEVKNMYVHFKQLLEACCEQRSMLRGLWGI